MKVSAEETKRIATLARIELDPDEVIEMSHDLTKMLDFVEKINELDTDNIPETHHTLNIQNVFRKDQVIPSMDSKDALSLGPKTSQGHFCVPPIIE